MKIETRNKPNLSNVETNSGIDALKPHPLSLEIYGDEPDAPFVQSVRKRGIIEPLIVDEENQILAGHRRWHAAKKAGIKEVPVRKVEITSEVEKERLILDSNRHREKSVEQRLREFAHYLAIEKNSSRSRRGQRTDLRENSSTSPSGRARDLAARNVGLSGGHAEIGLKVLLELDRRRDSHDAALSEKIRTVLNKDGIHAAHQEVMDAGWITKPAAKKKTPAHSRARKPPRASRSTKSPPSETEDPPPSSSIVKTELVTQIMREAVRDLERLDGAQLRQFLADLHGFKTTWLKNHEGAAHD